jgi:hypothetical protein
LDRHEETIHKRWLDKKPKQRLEILRKAWGSDMVPSHRPDFEYYFKDQKWQNENPIKVREAYMWPYINEEDLLQPRNLLWFMASRGRYPPASFAATDLQAMHTKLVHETVPFSGQALDHVMIFTGREDASCYGELLNFHERPDAAMWRTMGHGSTVLDGLLILEAQEKTMSFLVACVHLILHDVKDLMQGPKRLAHTLTTETATGFASLTTTASRAPYLPPAPLDLDRIVSLLAAVRDQAANHLWSLREDPGYYHDYVSERKEHRREMIKPQGQSFVHGIDPYDPKHEGRFWGLIFNETFTADHMQYEMYSELLTQAERLRHIAKSSASAIRPDGKLPEQYMHAILRFRYYLKETFLVLTQSTLPWIGSPLWRNHYYCENLDGAGAAHRAVKRESSRMSPVQASLENYLTTFTTFIDRSSANHGHADLRAWSMGKLGITKMMDAFQHLVESQPEAKALLTPYLASSVSNLATISECWHQLELYQPWANSFEARLTTARAEALRLEYAERAPLVEVKVDEALLAYDGYPTVRPLSGQLGRTGAPTKGRFAYPIWRSKNEETIRLLRTAESDLDKFWNAVDNHIMEKLSDMGESHLQSWLKQPRDLHRTAPWVEPPTNKVPSATLSLHQSVQELDLTRQQLTERTISDWAPVSQTKAKVKTRGNVNPVELEGDAHEGENAGVEMQGEASVGTVVVHRPKFVLNARALKVFKTIFFTPSINGTPGEVAWTDFLYAMKSIGFAPEAIGGSMWHFHPETVGVKHGIVFHSPHTASKMPYHVARRHGRELRRAYGWEGHMFSLA